MPERIQKVLSQWGIASRRNAEKMILAGRIQLNGQAAKLGDKVDLTADVLLVDGKVVKASHRPKQIYLLLNKPVEVVSTCKDPQNRETVIKLLPINLRQGTGIHPVGRLDYASSGALILTNDGELTLGLTHPRYHLPKTYLVELSRPPLGKDLACWRKGVILDGSKTLPAKINVVKSDVTGKTIKIVLTEGRNRQIRRVAQQLGYQIKRLHREAIGSINLNSSVMGELSSGEYRHLSSTEVNFLKYSFNSKLLAQTAHSENAVYDKE